MIEMNGVLERACYIYLEELTKSQEAMKYLTSRGVNERSIANFRLGFAPDNPSSLEVLSSKIDKDLLERAGLVKKLRVFYGSEFSNRIILPVFGLCGELIGFGGRVIIEERFCEPRYKDTAGLNGFNRGDTLYALNFAVENVNKKEELYVFEGFFDVIMAHQSGLINSAALLGTHLREGGMHLVRKLFPKARIKLCYDGDESGIKAAHQQASELKDEDSNLEVFYLRDYKDPAKLFENGKNLFDHLCKID